MNHRKISVFYWFVLSYNVFIILWGALVRATGSGAGCGSHWPLCNGVVVPKSPDLETLIEFTHRLTSGIALILVFVLLFLAFRYYPKRHLVRYGAVLSTVFIITEALIGAGLVLFGWVATDASSARIISIALHLTNTFFLLAFLTLTAWWSTNSAWIFLEGHKLLVILFAIAFGGVLLVGVTGAITALGDTLFPSETLMEGIQEDFSGTANFLIKLRVWHPITAVITGFYLLFLSMLMTLFFDIKWIKRFGWILFIIVFIQLTAGIINLILLAPVWLQLVHLLLADLIWINLVLLFAATVGTRSAVR